MIADNLKYDKMDCSHVKVLINATDWVSYSVTVIIHQLPLS